MTIGKNLRFLLLIAIAFPIMAGQGNALTESVNLSAGWNLISLPLDPNNHTLQSVLQSIDGKYWSVWTYRNPGGWERYIVGSTGNTLTTMEPGTGYWINMKNAGTLTITGGDILDTAVQLTRGWNLVGYNSLSARLRESALSSIEGLYWSVWTYENGQWMRYIEGAPGNTLEEMVPWRGYWINAKEDCTWTLETGPDTTRPVVDVTVEPLTAAVGGTVTVTVDAEDNVGVVSKELRINGALVQLDASGQAVYTSSVAGVFTAVGKALDLAGNEGIDSEEFRFLSTGDTTPPTVNISLPAGDAKLSAPADIVGTASDTNLIRYSLEYSIKDRNEFIVFASASSSVTNGVLGRLDPTMLRNGLYDIKLSAEDASGNKASVTVTYQLEGEMKVGNFSMSFNDLIVTMAGIPITITRTYDSRNKTKGDFGICWTLSISNVVLSESRTMGKDWKEVKSGWFPPTYSLQETKPHYITVTFPDGRTDEFYMVVDPSEQAYEPIKEFITASFKPKPGTLSSLVPLDDNLLMIQDPVPGVVRLLYDYDSPVYDPDRYKLTTLDGNVYIINQDAGLESMTDTNGNTITIGPGGIIHSGGKSVTFTRDSEGRITAITDPMGNKIRYAYDYYGDLVSVTDQEGKTTKFTYNSTHGIVDIIDPRGIRPARNEYDDEGRLIACIDAEGNRVEYTHDVGNQREVIRDRAGNNTIYEYDDKGNVVRVIDAYGNATNNTYDSKGNKLTETDQLGYTTTYTYDAQNNMLSQTDPLGNKTTYTYNSRGQVLTSTDPEGHKTTNTYDAKGNLTSIKDPMGNMTSYEHDAAGNVTKITDPSGRVTAYAHDGAGNLISLTNPLGSVTTYTYDSNGNRLTETTSRTTPSGAETITTRYTYDKLGQLIQTIDPYGNVTKTDYNAIGKPIAVTDRLGRRTEYEYDARGNLVRIIYPDETEERYTYDAEGRKLTFTDRAGRTTNYIYDKLGRMVRVNFPDGTFIQNEYDALGQLVRTIDELGNAEDYTYDAAGRKTSVRDALGNTTSYEYDKNGNITQLTDAKGNITRYEYDANNQRTRTIFPDGTSISYTYAAFGLTGDAPMYRKISETDQAGNTTQFEYDAVGRLVKVTDALGNEIRYAYDEVGNLISQTDANGRITRYEYDKLNRMTKRILPLGMQETFAYDAEGNVISHTDFNGDTVTFEYDVNNRLVKKNFPDGTSETYTYTATGQRQTVEDNRGITSYEYDQRDRLVRRTDPDGRSISYSYDAAGNCVSVTTPAGTTTFSFDELNRIKTVTDPDGGTSIYTYDAVGNRTSVTYPNGTKAEYTYDSQNRLTKLENRKSGGELISSYIYTLGPSGNRTKVVENTGRTVDYIYSATYKLTQEKINDPVSGMHVISYTYDAKGNRLSRNDNGVITASSYDENDRLLTEGGNTYTYDNNGNTLARSNATGSVSYTYDFQNRLIRADVAGASSVEYIYNVDGIRVQKRVNGTSVTNYMVDENGPFAQVLLETDGAGAPIASYAYGNDLISQKRNAGTSYYHYDGQMSTRQLTDASQTVVSTYTYDAFGRLISQTGTVPNEYLYIGEQFDPTIGFYYLRQRYYNPNIGRFTGPDPHRGDIYDPVSLHRYLYAEGDPINKVDLSGESAISLVEVMTVVLILSFTFPACTSMTEYRDAQKAGEEAIIPAQRMSVYATYVYMFNKRYYKAWFGDLLAWDEVREKLRRIDFALRRKKIRFYYMPSLTDTCAMVLHNDILLTELFFCLEMEKPPFSRAGVIIHEVSHMVSDTLDYSDGMGFLSVHKALRLAILYPYFAVENSYSYQFFAEFQGCYP